MSESQNIEWKESWRDEYLKWICGFANAQGGRIYIVCDDGGKVVGVDGSKKLLEDIPNKVVQQLGIVVDVNLLEEDGKEYIEIIVPSYPIGISYKGVYHYRSGSTKQQLTGPALEAFLFKKRGVSWDNLPLPVFRMEDVDDGLVERFRQLAAAKGRIDENLLREPKEILLEKLHLKSGEALTNAAMMLFSKDPEKYQVGAYVKIGYFETDADLRYQDEIRGSLLEIVDRIMEVMHLKYMRAQITYVGMQRRERYIVPDAALREALFNALCHSQYSYGVPIQISVYADKIYIANVGSLPEDWTAENLMKKHAARPGNPTIAQVFYYAGFIESWGRGIEKICEACTADGLPLPEYTIHPGDVMVKFSAPADRVVLGPEAVGVKVVDAVGVKVGETVGVNLTQNEKDILLLLVEDPAFKYSDIASKMGVTEKTVYKWIKSLKSKGVIERIGSDRTGYWKIIQ